jgi:hypothetical protein
MPSGPPRRGCTCRGEAGRTPPGSLARIRPRSQPSTLAPGPGWRRASVRCPGRSPAARPIPPRPGLIATAPPGGFRPEVARRRRDARHPRPRWRHQHARRRSSLFPVVAGRAWFSFLGVCPSALPPALSSWYCRRVGVDVAEDGARALGLLQRRRLPNPLAAVARVVEQIPQGNARRAGGRHRYPTGAAARRGQSCKAGWGSGRGLGQRVGMGPGNRRWRKRRRPLWGAPLRGRLGRGRGRRSRCRGRPRSARCGRPCGPGRKGPRRRGAVATWRRLRPGNGGGRSKQTFVGFDPGGRVQLPLRCRGAATGSAILTKSHSRSFPERRSHYQSVRWRRRLRPASPPRRGEFGSPVRATCQTPRSCGFRRRSCRHSHPRLPPGGSGLGP